MSQYDIIAFMCTVTSRRVGCGCTVWSFTTLGEYGWSLSLGLRPMKTHSSNDVIRTHLYKFMMLSPKDYYLIPGANTIKLVE